MSHASPGMGWDTGTAESSKMTSLTWLVIRAGCWPGAQQGPSAECLASASRDLVHSSQHGGRVQFKLYKRWKWRLQNAKGPTLEIIQHHSCCILLLEPFLLWGRSTKERDYWEAWSTGVKGGCHQCNWLPPAPLTLQPCSIQYSRRWPHMAVKCLKCGCPNGDRL